MLRTVCCGQDQGMRTWAAGNFYFGSSTCGTPFAQLPYRRILAPDGPAGGDKGRKEAEERGEIELGHDQLYPPTHSFIRLLIHPSSVQALVMWD